MIQYKYNTRKNKTKRGLKMEFSFYTKEEVERIEELRSTIREARFKMYKGKTKAEYTREERNALLENEEFQEAAAQMRAAKDEHYIIYKLAEKRYIPFVLKNDGKDFLDLVKERISVYTDYVGVSFLKQSMDNGHEVFSLFALRDELECMIADIYIKRAGENLELRPIFSQVQQIILNKAVDITAIFKDLYETGKLEAYLNGSDQIEGQQSFFDVQPTADQQENKNQLQTAKKRKEKAAEIGALMTIDRRIATPSNEALQHAFNGFSIFNLPGTAEDFDFDKTGKLNTFSLNGMELEAQSEIYTAFLGAMLQAVLKTDALNTDNNITFYVPRIYRELGLNYRKIEVNKDNEKPVIIRADTPAQEARLQDLMKIIQPFDGLVGKTPDGSFYRVLSFSKYDAESDTMTLNSPYLYKVRENALKLQIKENHSPLNLLFHSTVAKERNHEAVELANRILAGLLRRGTTPNSKGLVEWEAKYKTLIEDCPQLYNALADIEKNSEKHKTQRYNNKLRNTFRTAFKIIEEQSDAPCYYLDLKIDKSCPTKSMLRNKLKITHKGKNETFSGSFSV